MTTSVQEIDLRRSFERDAETYTVGGSCANCGWKGRIRIARGQKAPGVGLGGPSAAGCPTCGCYTVKTRWE